MVPFEPLSSGAQYAFQSGHLDVVPWKDMKVEPDAEPALKMSLQTVFSEPNETLRLFY